MDRYSSNRFSGGTLPSGPSGRWALRRLVAIGAIAAVLAAGIAPTSAAAAKGPRIGPVRVFACAPAPGHPFGIAVGDGRVYVSTSAGDFFADPANGGHRTPTTSGSSPTTRAASSSTRRSSTRPTTPTWACSVSPSTATPDRSTQLYVADMNGRILRSAWARTPVRPRSSRRFPRTRGSPATGCSRCGTTSSSTRPATSTCPTTSRGSGGSARTAPRRSGSPIPRLTGLFGFAGGPLGGRIDPTGQWLYISITLAARVRRWTRRSTGSASSTIRPRPTCSSSTGSRPIRPRRRRRRPASRSSKSGNLYVSLLGPNQVAVLDPAGNETRRISDPRFHSPWGLAFLGNKLLVTNGDLEPGDHPDAWKIFKVDVGETGLPLNEPRLPAG